MINLIKSITTLVLILSSTSYVFAGKIKVRGSDQQIELKYFKRDGTISFICSSGPCKLGGYYTYEKFKQNKRKYIQENHISKKNYKIVDRALNESRTQYIKPSQFDQLIDFMEVFKDDNNLADTMEPMYFKKRDRDELNIALLYYGNSMSFEHLQRVKRVYEERFYKATSYKLKLNILITKVINFKQDLPSIFTHQYVRDPQRLHRIWYYQNQNARVMKEAYNEFISQVDRSVLSQLDTISIITGAQFDGLGFATGAVSITEYPQEIAWESNDGGRVDYPSIYTIADELIHETGHNLFLGHAATQCQKPGMTYQERKACCRTSDNRNDVMSYCRDRSSISETKMFGFEACNMNMIKNKIIPTLRLGGPRHFKGRVQCK